MKLRVKDMDIATGSALICLLNQDDARELDLHHEDRILLKKGKLNTVAVLDIGESSKAVPRGRIGVFEEVIDKLKLKNNDVVEIGMANKPIGISYIKKKLNKEELSKDEIYEIIKEIVNDELTEIEISFFVSGCYTSGLTDDETYFLTKAIVHFGDTLKLKNKIVVDKHCLPANTPLIINENGRIAIKNIGEFVDSLFTKSKEKILDNNNSETIKIDTKNLKVLSFDNEGKTVFQNITQAFRVKSPDVLFKITTVGNRSIALTSDHSIFCLKKGKIINIPAKNIRTGDFLVVPINLMTGGIVKDITIPHFSDIDYSRCKKISGEIKITKEFMRVLGYYIGEGFTNSQGIFLNFGSHEKELIQDSIDCIKKVFHVIPTLNKPHKTAVRVSVYNQIISKVFSQVLNCGSNAYEKKIPDFVFLLSRDLQIELLKTMMKCDGHTRRGYESAYTTVSEGLMTQLSYLLSLMGFSVTQSEILPSKRVFPKGVYDTVRAYTIYTQAREIFGGRNNYNVSFINLLPISEIGELKLNSVDSAFRRTTKRQRYITKESLLKHIDAIESLDVKNIIKNDLAVLEVKSSMRIKSDSKFVYDLKVEKYECFAAGSAPIFIHNCSGGVPNNRTTMLLVPILAAAGLCCPKTSSRSITSPAGTADTMEVLAPVAIPVAKMKKIVNKTGGCIIWGGGMNLASADDKMIRVRHPLSLDPEGMLLASIMAKKAAVNSTHVLIDIPIGKETKIKSVEDANHLKKKFESLGKRLGMTVRVITTNGEEPIGNGIGPALEARDVLYCLTNDKRAPKDLLNKVICMSKEIFSMVGVENGDTLAKEILESGLAYKKMKEIIKAQGGEPSITPEQIKIGRFEKTFYAKKTGLIHNIDNLSVSKIARVAGAPQDKGAGMYIFKHEKEFVKKGEKLFTIYAQNKQKLDYAVKTYLDYGGFEVR